MSDLTTQQADSRDHHPMPMPPLQVQPLSTSAWAQVQARYVMAQAHPRVWAQVRYMMLHECQNFRFAEDAIWQLKIGGSVQRGFSIRFAEAAARAMRNLYVEVQRGHEDADERLLLVSVTDLESNYGTSQEVSVEKFVLRKKPPADGPPIVHQRNHYGEPLYRHPASEQDMLAKAGSLLSKTRRNLILSFLPAWLQEDCKVELAKTIKAGGNRVTGQLPRAILNSFADLGVSPQALGEYLGHDILASSPGELEVLRSLAIALREQELTWPQALEARRANPPTSPPPTPKSQDHGGDEQGPESSRRLDPGPWETDKGVAPAPACEVTPDPPEAEQVPKPPQSPPAKPPASRAQALAQQLRKSKGLGRTSPLGS